MKIRYSDIIRDYFHSFTDTKYPAAVPAVLILVAAAGIILSAFRIVPEHTLYAFPLFFTLISGYTHKIRLPEMMYQVPLTDHEREKYIGKMLNVKILTPVIFTVIYDLVFISFFKINTVIAVNQIIWALSVSFLFGTSFNGFYDNNGSGIAVTSAFPSINFLLIMGYFKEVNECKNRIAAGTIVFLFITLLLSGYCIKTWKNNRSRYSVFETTELRSEVSK